MQTLTIHTQIDADGRLRLDVPTQLPDREVDVVLVISPTTPLPVRPPHDFSAVAGRLKWRGDALAEQRRLRNEW